MQLYYSVMVFIMITESLRKKRFHYLYSFLFKKTINEKEKGFRQQALMKELAKNII